MSADDASFYFRALLSIALINIGIDTGPVIDTRYGKFPATCPEIFP